MKWAKEQIVGMVAAVDWVLSHTEESMQGDYKKRVDLIASGGAVSFLCPSQLDVVPFRQLFQRFRKPPMRVF